MYFFKLYARQGDSSLPDGKYRQNPRLVVTILIHHESCILLMHSCSFFSKLICKKGLYLEVRLWFTNATLTDLLVKDLCRSDCERRAMFFESMYLCIFLYHYFIIKLHIISLFIYFLEPKWIVVF